VNQTGIHHREILQRIAHVAMLERGLLPDFSEEVLGELAAIRAPVVAPNLEVRDQRALLWASIDNDDSLDLDQLTVAEPTEGGTRIFVAVADVDATVANGSAIDGHARHNTTSVYTAAEIFSMLPERLSTDLTSLNPHEDRAAIVAEMVVADDGSVKESNIYRAIVRNHAKLAYHSVAEWLEGRAPVPEAVSAVERLAENLRLQDGVAQKMQSLRRLHGALSLETIEARPVFTDGQIHRLEVERRNRAKDIIEDFMIAANGVTARFLSSQGYPSIRRVVRTPNRWERIVEIAAEHGFDLSETPDPEGLEQFLLKAREADPVRFPDLSLAIIKLLGPGEYAAEFPGRMAAPGHFGLAVRDYTHSTAPNRRYPDLITQRLLKAAMNRTAYPYDEDTMIDLAKHCTSAEDAAKKVERQVAKSAAALLLESRIGERFDAIVTGAAQKGTWVRLFDPPIEGRLVHGFDGLDVGRRVRVELLFVDVGKGYIDFKRVRNG
jgi:VacB/RNase II family 3'-5' exoribonuclease